MTRFILLRRLRALCAVSSAAGLIIAATVVPASAQQPSQAVDAFQKRLQQQAGSGINPKQLTLQQCVDQALENNLTIRRQKLALEQSSIDKTQADWAWWSPNVNAGVNFNRTFGTVFDNVLFSRVERPTNTSSPFLQLDWQLFGGLGRYYTRKQVQNTLLANTKGLERTKNTVVSNVVLAYMQVVLDLTNINISRTRIDLLKGQLDRVQRLFQAGAGVQFDVLNVQSQIAIEEINLTNAYNLYRRDKVTLLQLVMVEPTDSLDGGYDFVPVDTTLLRPTAESLRAPDLKGLETYALENMPEMDEARKRMLAADYGYRSTWGGYLPTLSFSAGANSFYTSNGGIFANSGNPILIPTGLLTSTGTDAGIFQRVTPRELTRTSLPNQWSDNFQTFIGFSLRIPIHNQLQRRRQVETSKIQQQTALVDYETTRNDLVFRVRQAYLDFIAAKTNLESITTQQVALNEAFTAAEKQYNAGLINFVQYFESLNNRSRVESQRVQAIYTLYFRKKILDFFGGKPLDFDEK